MANKILSLLTVFALLLTFAGCGQKDDAETNGNSNAENSQSAEKMGIVKARITVKDYGTVYLDLDGDEAPITTRNFVNLAQEKFYDGLTFHRIIDGFMIQGGDPKGNGTGGSDKTITGEFEANGIENNIKHTRGVISMARSVDPNSASSQFFIMHADAPHLDGQYAAFGHVTKGMEIIDKIVEDTVVIDDNGTVAEGKKPIIESIEIVNS